MSLPNTQPWPPLHFPRTPWPTAKSDLSPGYWVVGVNSAAAEYPTLLGQKYHPLTNATIFTFVFLITLQPQRYTVTVWLSHRMKQRCKIAQLVQFYYSFDITPQQGFCLQVKSPCGFWQCIRCMHFAFISSPVWNTQCANDTYSKEKTVKAKWERLTAGGGLGGPVHRWLREADVSVELFGVVPARSETVTEVCKAKRPPQNRWQDLGKQMLKHTVRNVTGNIATEENHTSPTRAHLEYYRHLRIRKEVCDAIALSCLKNEMYFLYSGKSNGCGICFYRNEEWWTDVIVRQLFSSLHQTSPRHLIIE